MRQTDPWGDGLQLTYDGNGNVVGMQDTAGGVVQSWYDGANRLVRRQYQENTGLQARWDISYTAAGQVAQEVRYADVAGTQEVGQTQYQYDAAGQVTQVQLWRGRILWWRAMGISTMQGVG